MSVKQQQIDWAFAQRTVTPELKIALLSLAFYADDTGRGSVLTALLAACIGVEPAAAESCVAALERFGMIYASVLPDGIITYRLNRGPTQ